MPKDAQHVAWLNATYLTFPAGPKPWKGRTQYFAEACNNAHVPVTVQGVDGVDSQIVGRHFSECQAKAANRPRAVRMTPEQNEVLQEAYLLDPYPSPGARMLIMHETGLNYKQVKHWYEQKAKLLRKITGVPAGHSSTNKYATQMWREWNKDERGYVQKLMDGSICPVTGRRLTIQGPKNNRSAQSTNQSSNAHAVQPNVGSVEHGTTFGVRPQPAQHLAQAGYYPMPTQTYEHTNQHGQSSFQDTQNYMHMQAQNQVNKIPLPQINNMPSPQINNMPPQQTSNMPSHQVDYMLSQQINNMSSDQIDNMLSQQVNMPSDQINDMLSQQVNNMPLPQINSMLPQQISNMPSDQINDMLSQQVNNMPSDQINDMLSQQVNNMPSDQINDMLSQQVNNMPLTQINSMLPQQISNMPSDQINDMLSQQVNMPSDQINDMLSQQVNNMPPQQISNMPPAQMNNMHPHHAIYPVANVFGVGPDYPGYDVQQTGQPAAYPAANVANSWEPNANPAYQNHSGPPLSSHQYDRIPANHQSGVSGDQFAARSFPPPEEPRPQWQDPAILPPRMQHSHATKLLSQNPTSAAPSKKRMLAVDGENVENTPRPEKRHRTSAPMQILPLTPSEAEMSSTRPFSESYQAIPHQELVTTPRKRWGAPVKNKTINNGQSTKRSRINKHQKPLPSVEYQKRHGLNFYQSEEYANETADTAMKSSISCFDWSYSPYNSLLAKQDGNAGENAREISQESNMSTNITDEMIDPSLKDLMAPRNEQPISMTASNAMGTSGSSLPDLARRNWEAKNTQEKESSTVFARSRSPAAESMHSEDGEFELDAGYYSIELPAQELPLPETLTSPQPESQYPELPLDELARGPGFANLDNFLPPSQVVTSNHNVESVDDFNYENFSGIDLQLSGGREYIFGMNNMET
ncbi:hypothetical protein EYC84_006307 [Monilinia fructicola]|uniref:Homeobox domain-containing protein n=1 Tax=Monilinia fructicola TaxID=38448 RepID=A0A5M9K7U5_MONFR|nr:hypothetical protein EYC84_006307 [Monilinia fructicola]